MPDVSKASSWKLDLSDAQISIERIGVFRDYVQHRDLSPLIEKDKVQVIFEPFEAAESAKAKLENAKIPFQSLLTMHANER